MALTGVCVSAASQNSDSAGSHVGQGSKRITIWFLLTFVEGAVRNCANEATKACCIEAAQKLSGVELASKHSARTFIVFGMLVRGTRTEKWQKLTDKCDVHGFTTTNF